VIIGDQEGAFYDELTGYELRAPAVHFENLSAVIARPSGNGPA
jgi:hypothetical protein